MSGSEVEDNFMIGLLQKFRTALHRLENAGFPFDTQVELKSFHLCYPANQ